MWENYFIQGVGVDPDTVKLESNGDFFITLNILEPKKILIYFMSNNGISYYIVEEDCLLLNNCYNFIQLILEENNLQRIYHTGIYIDKKIAFHNNISLLGNDFSKSTNEEINIENQVKILIKTKDQEILFMTCSTLDVNIGDFRKLLSIKYFKFLYYYQSQYIVMDERCESKVKLIDIIQKDNEGTNYCIVELIDNLG